MPIPKSTVEIWMKSFPGICSETKKNINISLGSCGLGKIPTMMQVGKMWWDFTQILLRSVRNATRALTMSLRLHPPVNLPLTMLESLPWEFFFAQESTPQKYNTETTKAWFAKHSWTRLVEAPILIRSSCVLEKLTRKTWLSLHRTLFHYEPSYIFRWFSPFELYKSLLKLNRKHLNNNWFQINKITCFTSKSRSKTLQKSMSNHKITSFTLEFINFLPGWRH